MIHEVKFITHSLLWTGAVKRTKTVFIRLELSTKIYRNWQLASSQSIKAIQEDNSNSLNVLSVFHEHELWLYLLLNCLMGQLYCFIPSCHSWHSQHVVTNRLPIIYLVIHFLTIFL